MVYHRSAVEHVVISAAIQLRSILSPSTASHSGAQSTMRVAIYGGSFDPVHLGHLWVAQNCAEKLRLDQVIFMPTATSPLKPHGPVASNEDRLMMLRLALGGSPQSADNGAALLVDDRELRRGGKSFTIDTIEEIKRQRPDDELFLLVGSDAFAAIGQWHRPEALLAAITPVVFRRGGDPPIDWSVLDKLVPSARIEAIEAASVSLPMIEVSSGEIRQRVADGRSIRFRVSQSVAAFIRANSLYQAIASP
jgi:nicotinate-nucleotide adenylyltransferase